MADIKTAYAASVDLTTSSINSLASSSSLLAGAETSEFDNSTNKYLDGILGGYISVGTTPTTLTKIEIWVAGILNDTEYPDVMDGTASAETVTNAEVKRSGLVLAQVIDIVATTSDVKYPIHPQSVATLFGGVLPKKFSVWVTHNTVAALKSSDHKISITPLYATAA